MMDKITIEAEAWLVMGLYLMLFPFSWVLAMVTAAAIHELGHCAALIMLDEPVFGIRIGAFGAKIETVSMEPGKEFWVGFAGPMFGLILCLFWRWIPKTALFALFQSLYNLLPLWPMDGGRMLRALRKWIKG